ncbi:beta-N-acetylhexosaminidase [Caldicoprobacter algeriensis]|uniref:beta-N-acetylhexosaminidase n=1 Tax=Caldicoprobacter algeriensis TaxID=699281 RepID=UPI00207AEB5F
MRIYKILVILLLLLFLGISALSGCSIVKRLYTKCDLNDDKNDSYMYDNDKDGQSVNHDSETLGGDEGNELGRQQEQAAKDAKRDDLEPGQGGQQSEQKPNGQNDNAHDQEPPSGTSSLEGQIEKYMNKMTLEEKVGQMLIVGFDGLEPSRAIKDMIQNYHVGSVILFPRNVKDSVQLVSLINQLKALNKNNRLPLIISADQEGGKVHRLPADATRFPANLILGRRNSAQLAYDVGRVTAAEMRAYGFNLNFAPVLDILSNPKNTVIDDRALDTAPDIVARLGVALMKGLRDGGVIPVIKHFPGHGDTVMDSHVDLPILNHDMQRLRSFELIPFKRAIEEGADMVMVAHILFPNITQEKVPASLSREVITGVLRQELGFDGVVISDDMEMGAIQKHYGIEDAAVRAVLAGTDIVSICHTYEKQKQAFEALIKAVDDGTIPMERIDESVKRIITLKLKYGLNDQPMDTSSISKIVGTKEHRVVADKAWGRE